VLRDERLAESRVVALPERRDVDVEEVGSRRGQDRKAELAEPRREAVAAAGEVAAQRLEMTVLLAEPVGDGGLQVRRRREGEELVRLRQHAQDGRAGADEADLPAGQVEDLAGRADLDRPLAHARQRDQRHVPPPVEHDVFPDLVADGDGIEPDAEAGEKLEVGRRRDRRGRVQRVVEEHDLGALREGSRQRLLGQAGNAAAAA
jgi:hypothetical protein